MMLKKLKEQQKISLGGNEIDLSPDYMMFNEMSLSEYYQREGGYYDYYSAQLAYADFLVITRDNDCDALYSEKFHYYKEEIGGSDKLAEARAKADPVVIEAKKALAISKLKKNLLQQYLRSWDRNHENALALGHMLRKEMDKLSMNVRERFGTPLEAREFDPEELEKGLNDGRPNKDDEV